MGSGLTCVQEHTLCGQIVLVVGEEPVRDFGPYKSLEDAGIELARASLQDAPRVVQQRSLSAVVLDCHPVSGKRRALIRLLRQRRVPFLFYSVEPPAEFSTERGAPFVARPSPPEKMIAAMRYLLPPRCCEWVT